MAATKRKRRGGLEVQAKKPKRSRKDAGQPVKQAAVAKEVEEEDRDRIPGPVCKVKGSDSGVGVGFVTRRGAGKGWQPVLSAPVDQNGQCISSFPAGSFLSARRPLASSQGGDLTGYL